VKVCYLIFLISFSLLPLGELSAQTELKIKKLEEKLKSASFKDEPVLRLQLAALYKTTNPEKAKDYANQAFTTAKKLKDNNLQAGALNMLGEIYSSQNDQKNALRYYEAEVEILAKMPHTEQLAKLNFKIASIYKAQDKLRRAAGYYEESLSIVKKLALKPLIMMNYEALFSINYDLANYKEAMGYFKSYIQIRDSVFNVKKLKEISGIVADLETEKKQKDKTIGELKQNSEVQNSRISELNYLAGRQQLELKTLELEISKKKIERNFLIAILSFILLIAFLLFNLYASKKKANKRLAIQNVEIQEQKEEIETQRNEIVSQLHQLELLNNELYQQKEEILTQFDEIEEKSAIIEQKNSDITKSIEYALRIQQAILPTLDEIIAAFPESFVLYKPKDIVSGDFYWMTKAAGNRIFIAVADCTGHGVPGGFMSMIGIEKLNDIVNQTSATDIHPAEILQLLDKELINTLRQTGAQDSVSDGMDIAICEFNFTSGEVIYAGANRPLWILKNKSGKIIEYEPVKKGIGDIYEYNPQYKNILLDIEPNDMIYIFSDGYEDQFGGDKKRKLMKKNMKAFFSSVHLQSPEEQREKLENYFKNWKQGEIQVDDVLILGIRYI
jgi:serine phosphatase RsbU (regulator of sigma subunit)